jgi:murein DD-endopeptidase MepM/ murein hydrolase activator NlpD
VILVLAAAAAVLYDYAGLRALRRRVPALEAQIARQQQHLGVFEQRTEEVEAEISTWREVHARIWQSFSPDRRSGGAARGLGGVPMAPADAASDAVSPGAGQRLEGLVEAVKAEGEDLRALERLMERVGRLLLSLPSRWPVRGAVNSEFGARASPFSDGPDAGKHAGANVEFHAGMDIATRNGTPVRAPAAGTVLVAGQQGGYGLCVVLDHGEDIRTRYGHLSEISVAPGERVARGHVLGRSGNSGRSTGPHLHYELLVRGRPVNPRAYLWNERLLSEATPGRR